MPLYRLIILSALLLLSFTTMAQLTNERSLRVFAQHDMIVLDSLVIIPGSEEVRINGFLVDTGFYRLNYTESIIQLKPEILPCELVVDYRVFPTWIRQTVAAKDQKLIGKKGGTQLTPYIIGQGGERLSLFDDGGLKKSGNISRGLAFGNAQNLAVNSALNLQLSGRLNERFELLASISDDNIPIQPDGNSAQLQDFDQVFIQLSDEHLKVIAGDFILRKPQGYFLNYFKRTQGAYVFYTDQQVGAFTVETSASVSKGRFARNTIQGVEANQGPYRLIGADGEQFVIVLAGTEAVFIDGKKLERGQDKDYVIDYNAAEITFTPKQLITKDRRIVVEFQYSEKRYARPMIQASISKSWNAENSRRVYFNLFSESDAKNQPLQQDLSQNDRSVLNSAGDDFLSAVVSGVDSVGYTNNQVLYQRLDSLGFTPVYVYSEDTSAAKFRVVFSNVGNGNGDYVEDGFSANGRKYKWVVPEVLGNDTIHKGSFAPLLLLVNPKKKQMISAGIEYALPNNKWSIMAEGALSNNDLNTFSAEDSNDDIGYAARFGLLRKVKRSGVEVQGDSMKVERENEFGFQYEYSGMHFSPIERFREVEFERNWNAVGLTQSREFHRAGIQGGYRSSRWGRVATSGEILSLGSGYSGAKWSALEDLKYKGFKSIANASVLSTSGELSSVFIRHKSDSYQRLGKLKVGFRDEHELNSFQAEGDSLDPRSYRFYDWEINFGTFDTTQSRITVYYRERTDWRTDSVQLFAAAKAVQYGLLLSYLKNPKHQLRLNVGSRILKILDTNLIDATPENTLLTRLEYSFKSKNGFLLSTTFYEVSSGLEQRREFVYFEVASGQGSYVWNDYDEDGVKDLNEFEVAQFAYEANYIRVFLQSSNYIKTFNNQLSQSIQFQPAKLWKNTTEKWKKTLSRFSSQTSYRIDRKTNEESSSERFNPFVGTVEDERLMSLNWSFRNILFFNKAHPTFSADYVYQQLNTKTLLSDGFESRGDRYDQFSARWTFYKSWTLGSEYRSGMKAVGSDFLAGRNYVIDYSSIKPKLTWQPNTSGRFILSGEVTAKENISSEGDGERASILRLGMEATLNSSEKGTLQASFDAYEIEFTGEQNTSLSFDMLEGLNAGRNYVWAMNVQRNVAKNVQLTLLYNGRKPQEVRTIHSGGVQVRAYF